MKSLTEKMLKSLVKYEPHTGKFFSRLKSKTGPRKVGDELGVLWKSGYVYVHLNGEDYRAHRLAWLYMFGVWPTYEIDHINHNRSDNRIDNLRDVPHSINIYNRKSAAAHNKLGVLGVKRATVGPRFVSQLVIDGKPVHLGTFDTAEEAHTAYKFAKISQGLI